MFRAALFSCSIVCFISCMQSVKSVVVSTTTKINDGKELENSEEYRAITYISNDMGGSCTGCIISQRHILTAAHCVISNSRNTEGLWAMVYPNEISVMIRESMEDWVDVDIDSIVIHPAYKSGGDGDIAIISLTRPIPTSYPMFRLAHPTKDVIDVSKPLISSGFGNGRRDGDHMKEVLSTCSLWPTAYKQCRVIAGNVAPDNRYALKCAVASGFPFSRGAGICPGDSGGPLYTNAGELVLYGVTSFLIGGVGVPHVTMWFTDVQYYYPLIKHKVISDMKAFKETMNSTK